jgi:squalene-hopene/tetraprenyl-beta-curcumene cyclase
MPEKNDIDKLLKSSLSRLEQKLIGELKSESFWHGKLSSSALATAVAMFALSKVDPVKYAAKVQKDADWLLKNVNQNGGWGDTPDSPSNISTTLLAWSALSVMIKVNREDNLNIRRRWEAMADTVQEPISNIQHRMGKKDGILEVDHDDETYGKLIERAEQYIKKTTGSLTPSDISRTILGHYGKDRTFSVPILTMCALAGRLGDDGNEWEHVIQLPYELSILPRSFFRLIGLPVVSYALPALIAMGMLRHRKTRKHNLFMKTIRNLVTGRAVGVLRKALPSSGGFLEAIPLTGFVTMSLIAAGCRDESIIGPCSGFLEKSFREDGSCPIDTNLATWLTTLSVKALNGTDALGAEKYDAIGKWLMAQQYRSIHPYTGTAPGGWAWTDLPGGVPDADDTAGALIALKMLPPSDNRLLQSASAGIKWLLDLQNRDGGTPTFCKGWGKLPFDRSCAEITAHMLEAFSKWRKEVDHELRKRMDASMIRGIKYLHQVQKKDGSWTPLWFGNQNARKHENPTYGTSRILISLNALQDHPRKLQTETMIEPAVQWLLKAQNQDHGWGGDIGLPSSIEETALAVNALGGLAKKTPEMEAVCLKGAVRLTELTDGCDVLPPSPIGLYFSMLWYSEKLYPLIFSVSALRSRQKKPAHIA